MLKTVSAMKVYPGTVARFLRVASDMTQGVTRMLVAAAEFSARHCIYPASVSVQELTTGQALVLAIFHSFSRHDRAAVVALLSAVDRVPQIWSSFLAAWLRDDYHFRRQTVADALAALSNFILVERVPMPVTIVAAMTGLEQKYKVVDFFKQSKDFTSQYLVVCLIHLVKKAKGEAEVKDSAVQMKTCTKPAWTQTIEQLKPAVTTAPTVSDTKPKVSAIKAKKRNKKRNDGPSKKRRKVSKRSKTVNKAQESVKTAITVPKSSLDERIVIQVFKDEPPTITIPEIQPTASIATSVIEPNPSFIKEQAEKRLLAAAVSGDSEMAQQALAAGASPDCSDEWGRTPLHLAARHGHSCLLSVLLRAGATVDRRDSDGWTPLHRAAHHGSHPCVKFLLDSGADHRLKVDGTTPLGLAKWKGHQAVGDLIETRAGVFYCCDR